MEIDYAEGIYCERDQVFKGSIILSEHKLYLKGPEGELIRTFVPLEKIEWIRLSGSSINIFVRPGISYFYTASIKGERKKIRELTKELVHRRGFKKKFLRNDWYEDKR